jgi:hypothetical protein
VSFSPCDGLGEEAHEAELRAMLLRTSLLRPHRHDVRHVDLLKVVSIAAVFCTS